ncbi:hypothetical protein F5Y16DRAFT_422977 [Xylariaceae sp. FL0255]|nr:hypothetical protein F5Y16DRAFT_422977 [Xylariaceae sp. FL0255]
MSEDLEIILVIFEVVYALCSFAGACVTWEEHLYPRLQKCADGKWWKKEVLLYGFILVLAFILSTIFVIVFAIPILFCLMVKRAGASTLLGYNFANQTCCGLRCCDSCVVDEERVVDDEEQGLRESVALEKWHSLPSKHQAQAQDSPAAETWSNNPPEYQCEVELGVSTHESPGPSPETDDNGALYIANSVQGCQITASHVTGMPLFGYVVATPELLPLPWHLSHTDRQPQIPAHPAGHTLAMEDIVVSHNSYDPRKCRCLIRDLRQDKSRPSWDWRPTLEGFVEDLVATSPGIADEILRLPILLRFLPILWLSLGLRVPRPFHKGKGQLELGAWKVAVCERNNRALDQRRVVVEVYKSCLRLLRRCATRGSAGCVRRWRYLKSCYQDSRERSRVEAEEAEIAKARDIDKFLYEHRYNYSINALRRLGEYLEKQG